MQIVARHAALEEMAQRLDTDAGRARQRLVQVGFRFLVDVECVFCGDLRPICECRCRATGGGDRDTERPSFSAVLRSSAGCSA